MWRRLLLSIIVLAAFVSVSSQASAQTVPPEFQDLYTTLTGQINSFASTVSIGSQGVYPVTYSPQLLSGNSGLGSQLLSPTHYTSTLSEVDSLKAMGANGVTVQIDFPI